MSSEKVFPLQGETGRTLREQHDQSPLRDSGEIERHDEQKTLGAVSATEGDAVPCSVHAPQLTHVAVIDELKRLRPHVEKWKTGDGREVRSRLANDLLSLIDARIDAVTEARAGVEGTEPRPTAWAYEQVCKARTKWQERAQRLVEMVQALALKGHADWDADRDMAAGKVLIALSGVRGLRPELDALYAEITNNEPQPLPSAPASAEKT